MSIVSHILISIVLIFAINNTVLVPVIVPFISNAIVIVEYYSIPHISIHKSMLSARNILNNARKDEKFFRSPASCIMIVVSNESY